VVRIQLQRKRERNYTWVLLPKSDEIPNELVLSSWACGLRGGRGGPEAREGGHTRLEGCQDRMTKKFLSFLATRACCAPLLGTQHYSVFFILGDDGGDREVTTLSWTAFSRNHRGG